MAKIKDKMVGIKSSKKSKLSINEASAKPFVLVEYLLTKCLMPLFFL